MKDSFNNTVKGLIKKIRKGDEKSFERLYYFYCERLFYFALKYLKTQEAAEELVQEIFVKLWEIRADLDPEKSFNSFLFTIAKNTIFNQFRKKINEDAYLEHLKYYLDRTHNKTENDIILADMKKRIDKCIAGLPPQRKKIYLMSREGGLSYKEIAKELEISEKTVEAHIRLALKTIRAAVNSEIMLPIFFMLSSSALLAKFISLIQVFA